MLVFTHQPDRGGWEFATPFRPGLQGGARTLEESVANAEHLARQHLSRVQGYPVEPDEVQHEVEHVVAEPHDRPDPV